MPDLTVEQWAAVGLPVRDKIEAGTTYSLNFEYRAAAEQEFQFGLGSMLTSAKPLVVSTVNLPPARDDWKTFWSAPFTASSKQLRDFPRLRLLTANPAGIEIRNVRILSQ